MVAGYKVLEKRKFSAVEVLWPGKTELVKMADAVVIHMMTNRTAWQKWWKIGEAH